MVCSDPSEVVVLSTDVHEIFSWANYNSVPQSSTTLSIHCIFQQGRRPPGDAIIFVFSATQD